MMTERFTDITVHPRHRFSLGLDNQTGKYYLSTPISGFNRGAEYEAYYWVSTEEFERFRDTPGASADFLESCRNHGNVDRRIT
ncbi:hypothetical protein [Devosia sp. A369]